MTDFLWQALDPLLGGLREAGAQLLPRVLVAVALLMFAWLVAVSLRWIASRAAGLLWFERVLWRSGALPSLIPRSLVRTRLWIAASLYWLSLLAGGAAALSVLSGEAGARLANFVLVILPNMLLTAIVVLATWWLSKYCARSALIWSANEGVTSPWHWALLVRVLVTAAGIALASEVSGWATVLVRSTFLLLVAAVLVVVGYALAPALRSQVTLLCERDVRARDEEGERSLLR